MLSGIAGKDDATITEAGEFKQLYHVVEADRPGFIQNHDRALGNLGAGIGIGQQLLQRHGIQTVLAERVGSGGRWRTEDRLKTFMADNALQFHQCRAFAGTSEAAKAGEAVGTGEDVRQCLALVEAEAGGWFVMVDEWPDRLDPGIDG